VLAHLPELVVKEVTAPGGYGMLIDPAPELRSTSSANRSSPAPERYIAQPPCPVRPARPLPTHNSHPHIDLRPFVLSGRDSPSSPAPHPRRPSRRIAHRQFFPRRHQAVGLET